MAEFVPTIFKECMDLSVYDPNFCYDDNEDEQMDEDEDAGDWGSDFDDAEIGGVDDDDDSSWKVRRAAVGVMDAIAKTRPEFHRTILDTYTKGIVKRFRERIDDVKCEIMDLFDFLIQGSAISLSPSQQVELELKHQLSRKKS